MLGLEKIQSVHDTNVFGDITGQHICMFIPREILINNNS